MASQQQQQQPSGAIPITNRVDGWFPSPRDLSTTPGGTMYATTPGGSRIMYERDNLLYIRNSPYSKTPTNLPVIPGLNAPLVVEQKPDNNPNTKNGKAKNQDDDEMFQMEH